MRRLQISLEPEQRCEQTEDREREHWLEAVAYGLQPKEREANETLGSRGTIPHSKEQGKRETDSQ